MIATVESPSVRGLVRSASRQAPLVAPRPTARLWTPGVKLLAGLGGVGVMVALLRFAFGLGAVTNLSDDYPWGLWKAFNVAAGIAIAAGGFTTAAFVEVFHRNRFRSLARPALLAAALGYTFAVLGLVIDIGRYYNIWHPILPSMWQGDSVLFEVAMCVMCYLTILYIEFFPIVSERVKEQRRFPAIARLFGVLEPWVEKALLLLIPAGVVISCLHQSSLGNLMLIAGDKLHPLWNTPILALLFLMSAVAVGFPVVITGVIYSAWALDRRPDMPTLGALARFIPPLVGLYIAAKVVDVVIREGYSHLANPSSCGTMFVMEMGLLIVPVLLLLRESVRGDSRKLLLCCLSIVVGVALNRVNVFLVAYRPPHALHAYFPSIGEWIVAMGLIAALLFCFRVIVTYLPVLPDSTPTRGSA